MTEKQQQNLLEVGRNLPRVKNDTSKKSGSKAISMKPRINKYAIWIKVTIHDPFLTEKQQQNLLKVGRKPHIISDWYRGPGKTDLHTLL